MPIPNPNISEDKETFISRCMSDENMKKEYSEMDQRYAICNSSFERNKKKTTDEKITSAIKENL